MTYFKGVTTCPTCTCDTTIDQELDDALLDRRCRQVDYHLTCGCGTSLTVALKPTLRPCPQCGQAVQP